MLTGVGTNAAFISVSLAGAAYISRWTVTVIHATDGVGVTLRALSAGVTNAGIISVAQQSCLSMRADTDKRCNSINACGAGAACCCCAVINVYRAVRAAPSINAHTDVTSNQVAAGASILTSVWLQAAFINVFCTVLTCPLWGALTVVSIDAVHAGSSVCTLMTGAVINVILTVCSIKTWEAVAIVAGFRALVAGASIQAG